MAEKKLYKVPCSRCLDDKGVIKAFSHIQNGVCFKCNGLGYSLVKTNPEVLNKAKIKREEKRKKIQKDREALGVKQDAERELKYKHDSRIGHDSRAKCANHEMYAYQTYQRLEEIDNGIISAEMLIKKPWILEDLSE